MTETAARAEQIVSSGFSGPYYTWEVPGKPLTVAIPLSMMDRLEQEIVLSFRNTSSLGSEVGGVLFGTAGPGKPSVVTVSSYEPVPCDYSLGPLYHLSESDLSQFDRIVARAKASGLTPVGFFRSHTRKGLSMDPADRTLLDLRFGDPHSIALLIRPYAAKASTAGIFFRENGEFRTESSYLEFPFRSTQCISGAKPAPPAGARAQIVPIASRREPVLADMPFAVAPVSAPELEAPAPPPAPVAKPVPAPVVAPAPVIAERIVEKQAVEKPAVEKPEKPAPATAKASKRIYAYLAATVLIVGLVSAAYFGGVRRGGTIPVQDSGMALRVERSAGELLLTWNRDAAPIRNAAKAVLQISDGTQQENVEMDLAQLRNGTIVYSPVTADVVFRMDITGADQKQIASESVRVLRTRPSPLATDTPQQTQPGAPPAVAADKTTPAATEAVAEEEAKPAGRPRVTRAFNAESLSHRLRPATATDMADAPTLARQASSVPSMPAGLTSVPSAIAAPAPAPEKAAPLGGQIETARLISRKDPEYPKMAREAGAKGAVKLVATVGSDGRVLRVKAISGHPLLVRPATEAVMQWVYRPTYLNGVAVETQTDITLNFVSER